MILPSLPLLSELFASLRSPSPNLTASRTTFAFSSESPVILHRYRRYVRTYADIQRHRAAWIHAGRAVPDHYTGGNRIAALFLHYYGQFIFFCQKRLCILAGHLFQSKFAKFYCLIASPPIVDDNFRLFRDNRAAGNTLTDDLPFFRGFRLCIFITDFQRLLFQCCLRLILRHAVQRRNPAPVGFQRLALRRSKKLQTVVFGCF